jgi:DNA-directed RNA polymerase subunit RPC12/RpoP
MSLFDRESAAGAVASRIDHQDAVAVLVILRCLAGEQIFGLTVDEPNGVILHCEGLDDLELVTPKARCLISVKALSANTTLIASEYSRLSARSFQDSSRSHSVALVLIGPQRSQIVSLADQMEKARSLLAHRESGEAQEVLAGFHKRWPQIRVSALNDFHLAIGWPRLHSGEYTAVAAQLLRKMAPLTDYTDDRVNFILLELGGRFAQARHARSSVALAELRDRIFSFAMPIEVITLAHEYVRTKYGYLPHPEIRRLLEGEAGDVRSAVRHAMRRYRKNTRMRRFVAISRGPVNCIACNGPLMANLWGWRARGIACSHCGFSPFISLFYACTCGRPILLIAQPPLDPVDIAVSLRHEAEAARCDHCGKKPKLERLQTRIFQLNIPWPPEEFSDKDLMQARKDFGWSSTNFRNGTANATEVLLREALDERIDRRLPRKKAR